MALRWKYWTAIRANLKIINFNMYYNSLIKIINVHKNCLVLDKRYLLVFLKKCSFQKAYSLCSLAKDGYVIFASQQYNGTIPEKNCKKEVTIFTFTYEFLYHFPVGHLSFIANIKEKPEILSIAFF